MSIADVAFIQSQVLWWTLGLSILFGIVAQRSHFCTMGAVSDIVNMSDWTRIHMWGVAIAFATLGFAGLAYLGVINPEKSLYSSNTIMWLSSLLGGLMFGFGMVLASGCGSKTLLRIGAGSLKSVVVFIVMGIAAFATLKGVTAVARVNTVDLVQIKLAQPDLQLRLILSTLLALALFVWALRNPAMRQLQTLVPAFVIGGIVSAMWWVSGKVGYLAEHPDTLQEAFLATNSGRMESLSFVAPVAYMLDWLMMFSDKSKVLSLGIVAVFGVILGGLVDALLTRTFRWEGFGSVEDLANHLVGGLLMGIGGVTAMGCTIGQGLSGVSTLALGSFIALAAILAGAFSALKYQMWRLDSE